MAYAAAAIALALWMINVQLIFALNRWQQGALLLFEEPTVLRQGLWEHPPKVNIPWVNDVDLQAWPPRLDHAPSGRRRGAWGAGLCLVAERAGIQAINEDLCP